MQKGGDIQERVVLISGHSRANLGRISGESLALQEPIVIIYPHISPYLPRS